MVAMSDLHFISIIFFSFSLLIREEMDHFFEYLLTIHHYCANKHLKDWSCLEEEFYAVVSLVGDFRCQILKR